MNLPHCRNIKIPDNETLLTGELLSFFWFKSVFAVAFWMVNVYQNLR